jgi:hypothetical protein
LKPDVPADSVTTVRLSAAEVGLPVTAPFNHERIVARGWPVAENRISIAELTYSLVFDGFPAAEVPSSRLDFRHHSVERWRCGHI